MTVVFFGTVWAIVLLSAAGVLIAAGIQMLRAGDNIDAAFMFVLAAMPGSFGLLPVVGMIESLVG